jgi:hypothetical protein
VASLEARDVVEIDEETFIGHATCIMGLADLIDKKFSSRNDILS